MYWLIALMTMGVVAVIVFGIYLELRPTLIYAERWYKPAIGTSQGLVVISLIALVLLGGHELSAAAEAAQRDGRDISLGMALAIIGIGLPTAVSTIAAGIAVGTIGTASLAVLAEKPEVFGRTLIYLGLAEGIAIYGLVVSILLLDKI